MNQWRLMNGVFWTLNLQIMSITSNLNLRTEFIYSLTYAISRHSRIDVAYISLINSWSETLSNTDFNAYIFPQREYWASDTAHRLHMKEVFNDLYLNLQMGYKLKLTSVLQWVLNCKTLYFLNKVFYPECFVLKHSFFCCCCTSQFDWSEFF